MSDRLGGAVARRPLHLFFVLDVSGSMLRGGRIQALNNAIAEVIPHLRDEARNNPHADVLIRVLAFANEATWTVEVPTPVEEFRWQRLEAVPQGFTEMGSALDLLADALTEVDQSQGAFPPAIILVSDGMPTETTTTFADGLERVLATRSGTHAVRLALGVGRDADLTSLRRFIGNDEIPLLRADSPEQLIDYVVWASKVASRGASLPAVANGAPTYAPPPAPAGDPIWSTLR